MLIIYNIITRNYCLNKTTLIFAVAFLLSDSIFLEKQIFIQLMHERSMPLRSKLET